MVKLKRPYSGNLAQTKESLPMNAQTPHTATHGPANMLAQRAMLATLNIRQWSARKIDKRITDEINTANGADSDAGRYNKVLVAKEALGAIVSAATAARALHSARTLPWLDDGARILPSPAYAAYSEAMRQIRVRFESAVDDFLTGYDAFVDDARIRLGRMFNESDYPSRDDIRGKFGFGVRVLPMPDAADFRAEISDFQAATIRAEIEESTRLALQVATADAWQRINETVAHMVNKLNAYRPSSGKGDKPEGIFRDSLVENVRDLVTLLPGFNLTNDPFMAQTIARIESDLCAREPEDLREDPIARQHVADAAQEILDSVAGYLA
jgi:hypothetical protein